MKKPFLKKGFYHILLFSLLILLIALLHERGGLPFLRGPHLPAELTHLPHYVFLSFSRMLAAYILSLCFALSYGYVAATNRQRERILVPVLDILQSIPVLGFFPAAIFFFVTLTHGDRAGIEMASIFLIFTSQAWNLTFGVYEALTTLPTDLLEASHAYHLRGTQRFLRLILPSCIPRLVENSIYSWAGGWYFLIACEIIAIGPVNYKLPGLGSFLVQATEEGKLGLTLAGLGALIVIIIGMDIFLWRPLTAWSGKFRYEFSGTQEITEELPFTPLWRPLKKILRSLKASVNIVWTSYASFLSRFPRSASWIHRDGGSFIAVSRVKKIGLWAFSLMALYLSLRAGIALAHVLLRPWPQEATLIPLALLASTMRLFLAYLISLVWTVPAAYWVSRNERALRLLAPLAQIGASIPATALFPLIVFVVIRFFGNMNIASILLILTGMQWYLLFNLMGGARNIPGDLKEAAASLGLSRTDYVRRLFLPAVCPSLVTGSITAWGGGWNALIVSEYLVYKKESYSVLGIGSLLSHATYVTGNTTMIFLSLASMVTLIVLMNRFFWRRLYVYCAERFKIDY